MTTIGHNGGPHLDGIATNDPATTIFAEIDDLMGEARNWADGEPIDSEAAHDAVTVLFDGLHDAGKRADELRKAEKAPLDEAVAAVQAKFNPYIQPKRGKVDIGKAALGELLAKWRARVAAEKAEIARKERVEADRIAAEAQAAIRASAGNLVERERAEALLDNAKVADRMAKRADKAATVGTGLRTVWLATMTDEAEALEWAYMRDAARFTSLVQSMADEAVRAGARTIPGFRVMAEKVAR